MLLLLRQMLSVAWRCSHCWSFGLFFGVFAEVNLLVLAFLLLETTFELVCLYRALTVLDLTLYVADRREEEFFVHCCKLALAVFRREELLQLLGERHILVVEQFNVGRRQF